MSKKKNKKRSFLHSPLSFWHTKYISINFKENRLFWMLKEEIRLTCASSVNPFYGHLCPRSWCCPTVDDHWPWTEQIESVVNFNQLESTPTSVAFLSGSFYIRVFQLSRDPFLWTGRLSFQVVRLTAVFPQLWWRREVALQTFPEFQRHYWSAIIWDDPESLREKERKRAGTKVGGWRRCVHKTVLRLNFRFTPSDRIKQFTHLMMSKIGINALDSHEIN